jgi:hypothetical protein
LRHDKKIVLLPMSPEAIVRDDIARAAKAKSENNKLSSRLLISKMRYD